MPPSFKSEGEEMEMKEEKKDEKLAWAKHEMILNPARGGVNERVIFRGVLAGGKDLVIGCNETVVLSHEEWEKVKDVADAAGRKYLARV